ncbi:uncharacterized protein LOC141905974 isoform X2 [Tubulanus polymorphus]|uniref:uncharacterized protein LOC141905974 isoform X2 n=1 Tax=Tubulanus polymorphus TaxID=672921 RepID=UPI003DA3026F
MAAKFSVGDLVWAKMKGFPAWPGKVIEPKLEIKKPSMSTKKIQQFVFFFGSENYAYISEDNLWPYAENKSRFVMSSRIPRGFKEAVEAIDDFMKNQPSPPPKTADLPSIDQELSIMFPERPPHKDYTREPLSGKKSSVEEKKSTTKRSASPNQQPAKKLATSGAASKLYVRIRPDANKSSTASGANIIKITKPLALQGGRTITPGSIVVSPVSNTTSSDDKDESKLNTSDNSDLTGDQLTKIVDRKPMVAQYINSIPVSGDTSNNTSQTTPPKAPIIATPSKIGFLGLGTIGQGIVMNLLKSGHEVTVWNRTAAKCRDFVKVGALKGLNAAEVVQSCDITFSCVSDPVAVKDMVFGNNGILNNIRPGKSYVDMSTVDVETVTDIYQAITARGGRFLEAPVCGSRQPALDGELIILAAGDKSLYDDCYSCFESMSKKSLYLGDVGNGARMRLCVSSIAGVMTSGLAEGMALADRIGIKQEDLLEVLALSSLSSPLTRTKGQAMMIEDFDPNLALQHQQKDLRLALHMSDTVEQPLVVCAAANELFKKAKAMGYGENDTSAVYKAAMF